MPRPISPTCLFVGFWPMNSPEFVPVQPNSETTTSFFTNVRAPANFASGKAVKSLAIESLMASLPLIGPSARPMWSTTASSVKTAAYLSAS